MKIVAFGIPAPQGSKKLVGTYKCKKTGKTRGMMADDNPQGLGAWRDAVTRAGRAAMNGAPPMDGALIARLTFTMPKPASAPKTRKTHPNKKPDGDKLERATFDALTKAGVWVDDARVIGGSWLKVFPNEHPDALAMPGVRIEIEVIA